MFDPTSRYFNIENATLNVIGRDGTPVEIRYLKRRFIPTVDGEMTLQEHIFTEGERLDNITARYLGDPTQFWRVCDTNNAQAPGELEEIGRVIKIALPHT